MSIKFHSIYLAIKWLLFENPITENDLKNAETQMAQRGQIKIVVSLQERARVYVFTGKIKGTK